MSSLRLGEIEVDAAQSHHARDVLRLECGTKVELFDDAGATAAGEIVKDHPRVIVRVAMIEPKPNRGIDITIASAVPKGERADWMIEKLSELGVGAFVPLQTARSIVHPRGEAKRQRWQRIATEASKQSRRAGVMQIHELMTLPDALGFTAPPLKGTAWPGYLSTEKSASPIVEHLEGLLQVSSCQLFIGPEGGWTDEEVDLMYQSNLTAVKLTATILRVETAAIAAASIVASLASAGNIV